MPLYLQPFVCLIGMLFNGALVLVFVRVWNDRGYYRKTTLLVYLLWLSLYNIVQLVLTFPAIILPAVQQVCVVCNGNSKNRLKMCKKAFCIAYFEIVFIGLLIWDRME